jgi:hypothetical protein
LLLKKSILLSTSLSYKNEFYEDDLEPLSSQKHKSRFRKFFFWFDSRCLNRLEGVLGLK